MAVGFYGCFFGLFMLERKMQVCFYFGFRYVGIYYVVRTTLLPLLNHLKNNTTTNIYFIKFYANQVIQIIIKGIRKTSGYASCPKVFIHNNSNRNR